QAPGSTWEVCRHAGQPATRRDPGPRSAGSAIDPRAGLPRDPQTPGTDVAVPGPSRTGAHAGTALEATHRTASPERWPLMRHRVGLRRVVVARPSILTDPPDGHGSPPGRHPRASGRA